MLNLRGWQCSSRVLQEILSEKQKRRCVSGLFTSFRFPSIFTFNQFLISLLNKNACINLIFLLIKSGGFYFMQKRHPRRRHTCCCFCKNQRRFSQFSFGATAFPIMQICGFAKEMRKIEVLPFEVSHFQQTNFSVIFFIWVRFGVFLSDWRATWHPFSTKILPRKIVVVFIPQYH